MREQLNMSNIRIVITVIAFGVALLGLCMPAFADDSNGTKPVSEVTGIEILDHAVKITLNGPIRYKINKPDDPFRAIVEIEGASIGTFRNKIYSAKPGITEIAPLQTHAPVMAAHLNILLPAPSSIDAAIKDDALMLYIKEDAKTVAVAQDAAEIVTTAASPDPAGSGEGPARSIVNVLFTKAGEVAELVIEGDGMMPDPIVFELSNKVTIEIPGVLMSAPLPSDITAPLKKVSYKADQGKVRFILELERDATAEVAVLDDELMVSIRRKDVVQGKAKAGAASVMQAGDQKEVKETARLISLDFQDADIVPILRLLGDVSGYNIVVHPEVKGRITMKLMNVPWEQALDIVLKTFNLEKVIEGNVIRVATLKAFQDEKKAIADTKEVFGKAEDIETRVFTVNYANVEKVKESIDKAKALSPRGSIGTDTRTRSLIVKDIPSVQVELQKLIESLDKPTPQVLIEARMVEINKNLTKDLGIQWGFSKQGRYSFGGTRNPVTDVSDYTGSPETQVGTGQVPAGSTTSQSLLPLVVNLPAAVGSGAGAAFGFGYINRDGSLLLDFRLSALESSGRGKIISNPKIMTVENEQAIIRHGAQIPVTTRLPDGTFSTTYKDANIKLTVTPQVTPDGTVFLKVDVNKDEPDFSRTDSLGNPTINSRSATTQVLLRSGETIAIGGILKSNETESESAVPGVSKIPILGRLFKRDTKGSTAEELLIFITPSIVQQ
ncbi:MAG: type IV pilus secretin PilQ [Nitrospirota bacterium]